MSPEVNLKAQIHRLLELQKERDEALIKLEALGSPNSREAMLPYCKLLVEEWKLEESLIHTFWQMEDDVIDCLNDPRARIVVSKLMEKSRKNIDTLLRDEGFWEMDQEDENEAWNAIYDLIGSPLEFLCNRRRVNKIVTLASIPMRIRELLTEAKTCFITNQTNAVYALGRMMIEYTIIDIGVRLKLFPKPNSVDDFYDKYPPFERANLVLGKGSPCRKRFRDLYTQGSRVIHSSHDRINEDLSTFLEETIKLIGDVYTANHRQLQ